MPSAPSPSGSNDGAAVSKFGSTRGTEYTDGQSCGMKSSQRTQGCDVRSKPAPYRESLSTFSLIRRGRKIPRPSAAAAPTITTTATTRPQPLRNTDPAMAAKITKTETPAKTLAMISPLNAQCTIYPRASAKNQPIAATADPPTILHSPSERADDLTERSMLDRDPPSSHLSTAAIETTRK